jgi:hypothetical protein
MARADLTLTSEPKYELVNEENQARFMVALNWYNYEKDKKDALAYAGAWIKKNWPAEFKLWARIDESAFSRTYGWIARMKSNGTVFDTSTDRRFEEHLREVLATAQTVQEEPVAVVATVTPKRSIQDAMLEKQAEFLGEVEGEIDNFVLNGHRDTGYSLYKYCQGTNVAKQYIAALEGLCNRQLAELAEIGKDAQITEGYSHLGKRDIKAFTEFLNRLIEEGEKYANFKKANRKVRVKKQKPAGEQVSKLQYLREFTELKLKSVMPSSIIGANQLWVYNTKNKKLGVYNASGTSGFSVKGTSLQGYDPETSVQRTLRKPDVVIAKMMTAGKVALRKILPDLTTTETALNGRFNADILLLRVM